MPPEILQGLATGSPLALVLAWALWYITNRATANQESINSQLREFGIIINRLVRADLLRLIVSPHASPEVKDEAATIIREIDPNDNPPRR